MAIADRSGKPIAALDKQQRLLKWLYTSAPGRLALQVLTRPGLSRFVGRFMDSSLSRALIPGFVKNNGINLAEYEQRRFDSFNDFFCRKILPGKRPLDPDENALISPADSKLTVLPITDTGTFSIKQVPYTFEQLVRDKALAKRFTGGTLLIFRLTVSDYHRYSYPCPGVISPETKLAGVLHTVNPVAAEALPIYAENCREYALIDSPRFGTVLMMEVGAMLVGRIVNDHPAGDVTRGAEKGHFEYGGSTVILALEKDAVTVDQDLIRNSRAGLETAVRLGERVGIGR